MKDDVISSVDQIGQFIETSIHTDYLNELDIRIEQCRLLLEDPDQIFNGRQYDLARGGVRVLREMKDLFEQLMANKEADMERLLFKENKNA